MMRVRARFPIATVGLLALARTAAAQERPVPPLPPPHAPASEPEPAPASPAATARPAAAEEPARPLPLRLPPPRVVAASPEDGAGAGPPAAMGVRVTLGMKLAYVPTSGFDMFASNDALPHFSVDATYGLLSRGRLALAAGLGWDAGGRSGELRAFDTSLSTHRLTVPLEARWAFTRGLWGLARIAPGAAYASAEVEEASAPNLLEGSAWGFAVDASVGAAVLVGRSSAERRGVRFVLMPEVGYMFTTSMNLRVKPERDAEDVLGADAQARLGSLALSGFFWRATLGAAF